MRHSQDPSNAKTASASWYLSITGSWAFSPVGVPVLGSALLSPHSTLPVLEASRTAPSHHSVCLFTASTPGPHTQVC